MWTVVVSSRRNKELPKTTTNESSQSTPFLFFFCVCMVCVRVCLVPLLSNLLLPVPGFSLSLSLSSLSLLSLSLLCLSLPPSHPQEYF